MATLAAYAAMMERDRKREGLRVCRAAWLVGVSVRRYRAIESGEAVPTFAEWKRMVKGLPMAPELRAIRRVRVTLVVSLATLIGFAWYGFWLIVNRDRLDTEGATKPNSYISAGRRAMLAFGLAWFRSLS